MLLLQSLIPRLQQLEKDIEEFHCWVAKAKVTSTWPDRNNSTTHLTGMWREFEDAMDAMLCTSREAPQMQDGNHAARKKAMKYLMKNTHHFSSMEAQQLLHNKFVVILGDSIYRSIYKDLILLLQCNRYLTETELKQKGEKTFENDSRVEWHGLHPGTDYREVREYHTAHHLVHYYFISRVYSDYMEKVLDNLRMEPQPDVVIVNSCLWDLNRYHDLSSNEPPLPKALQEYRQNLERFLQKMDAALPQTCLIIWNTALPIAKNPSAKGLFRMEDQRRHYTPSLAFHPPQPPVGADESSGKKSSPQDVISANFYSATAAYSYDWDVLDLHCHLRHLEAHRVKDGTHWNGQGHRIITKLLLTHIAEAWGVKLVKKKRRFGIGPNRNTAIQPAPFPPRPLCPPPPLPPPEPHCSSFPGPPPAMEVPPGRFRGGCNLPFCDGGSYNNWPVGGNEQGDPNRFGLPSPAGQHYFGHPRPCSSEPGAEYEQGTWFPEPQFPLNHSYEPLDHHHVAYNNRPEYREGPLHPDLHHNGPLDQPQWDQGPLPPHGQFRPNSGTYSSHNGPMHGLEQGPAQLPLHGPGGPSNVDSRAAYGERPTDFWYAQHPMPQYAAEMVQNAFSAPEHPEMPRGTHRRRPNGFRSRPGHPYSQRGRTKHYTRHSL